MKNNHRLTQRIAFYLIIGLLSFSACKSTREPREVRKYEKQEKKLDKQANKDYNKLLKTHRDRQSDETQKMMRKASKDAKKKNRHLRK